ncbi:MAG TPA: type II toxin-antitoxin system HipA family toxin [Bacteroidales bacterium]|nr:type II toxin-antitoxin system HipA family toxin [Bacteroidales bacterium]HOH21762.1 type II toxin-antitoxin system HipA family toxin [Bacteroidales bacterium]HPB57360.1 type II toxin-antitoxin system HipA family toxin [Bacteroidales bacterium]HPZ02901.1 type II toxin-antitoxin system HipA family toxin [Bacteroidales bacterium]HQB74217.1 type II toxin-antitoxin system HipA family toxin [Bacteroidales bacterium]
MKIPDKIEVWMHHRLVGRMAMTPDGLCAFEYSAEWLTDGFSISPFELPLTADLKIAKRDPFEGGFGVFDDCLPDGWGQLILSRYLLTQGIQVEKLNLLQQLYLVGSQGRGALEFRPDQSFSKCSDYVNFERLAAESEAILSNDNYTGDNLQELVQRGGSPGGARPKIFVTNEEGEWLVKFPAKQDPKNIGKQELYYAELTQKLGIRMMPCKLFDNRFFGTKRFDRQQGTRQHVISAAGLLGADYRVPSIDYKHLFQVTSLLTHSMVELWQLYKLMCFNVFIGNKDDHAKNFAFLYDGEWQLAPAYDLLPSDGFNGYHTTTVNNAIEPTPTDLLALATEFGLDQDKAEEFQLRMKNELKAE